MAQRPLLETLSETIRSFAPPDGLPVLMQLQKTRSWPGGHQSSLFPVQDMISCWESIPRTPLKYD